MAINQHHTCEELDGVKCAVVEKNVSAERAEFLRALLSLNGYAVIVAAAAPPKSAPAPAEGEEATVPPVVPVAFTVGVSDVMFNSTNAVFGRLLRTADGRVVTRDYWLQRSAVSDDTSPYFSVK
ncbi:MAG: hypothetical protein RL021_1462 [Bacteroidota bacterium]|jgi:NAD/NADP transhydrogenase alpha subunit